MSYRAAVAALGLLLVIVGALIGFAPHSLNSGSDPVSCGSAFVRDSGNLPAGADLAVVNIRDQLISECDDKLSGPRIVSLSLIGAGLVAVLFIGLTSGAGRRSESPQQLG